MTIFLPTRVPKNLTYILLVIAPLVISGIFDYAVLTPEIICEYYSLKCDSEIKSGLESLVKSKLARKKGNMYIINKSVYKSDHFTMVPVESVIKLSDNSKLLTYYTYILSKMNNKTKSCSLPISHFVNETGLSKRTVIRYNQKLEDMQLLYITRFKYDDDGREVNQYSLISNSPTKDKGNFHRSVSAKYNAFIKKGAEAYTKEELQELYDLCLEYNKQVESKHRKNLTELRKLCYDNN